MKGGEGLDIEIFPPWRGVCLDIHMLYAAFGRERKSKGLATNSFFALMFHTLIYLTNRNAGSSGIWPCQLNPHS